MKAGKSSGPLRTRRHWRVDVFPAARSNAAASLLLPDGPSKDGYQRPGKRIRAPPVQVFQLNASLLPKWHSRHSVRFLRISFSGSHPPAPVDVGPEGDCGNRSSSCEVDGIATIHHGSDHSILNFDDQIDFNRNVERESCGAQCGPGVLPLVSKDLDEKLGCAVHHLWVAKEIRFGINKAI